MLLEGSLQSVHARIREPYRQRARLKASTAELRYSPPSRPSHTMIPMPACFLFKTEPAAYSFDDFLRDKETNWDGVTNPTAVKNLRESSGAFGRRLPNAIMAHGQSIGELPFMAAFRHPPTLFKRPDASYPPATEDITMTLGLAIGYSGAHLAVC